MKHSVNAWALMNFYHSAVKTELKKRGAPKETAQNILAEYKKTAERAKDIGKAKLLGSYIMGIYFIAMNRCTGRSAEENFEMLRDGLCASPLFHKVMGNAESYLDPKKLPARLKWSEESHKRTYENDWVVDILTKTDDYELGYDYHECGVCKLYDDEGCPELAPYMCRMDFVLADIMDMKLVRTGTIAEGAELCDFRYSRK